MSLAVVHTRADDDAVFLDETGHVSVHAELKRWQALSIDIEKIKELPLRHQGDEAGVRRQMREVGDGDLFATDIAGELSRFLMWSLQEFFEQPQLIHDFQS